MDKIQRNERIAVLFKILSDSPGKIFTLGYFAEMFASAKSSISEDIDVAANLMSKFGMGMIETISGASGGVRYVPYLKSEDIKNKIENICLELSRKERILPGGFIYMLDILSDPEKAMEIGRVFAARFMHSKIDYVITVETKGIPLAFSTAKYLNIPFVIVRHYNEATDGASVNINYISGSLKTIQTMALSTKALKRNSRLLFIDDFMKGGGTARGIFDLAREFDCDVVGMGILIETLEPAKKLMDNYMSLLTLYGVDEEKGRIDIRPSVIKI